MATPRQTRRERQKEYNLNYKDEDKNDSTNLFEQPVNENQNSG